MTDINSDKDTALSLCHNDAIHDKPYLRRPCMGSVLVHSERDVSSSSTNYVRLLIVARLIVLLTVNQLLH